MSLRFNKDAEKQHIWLWLYLGDPSLTIMKYDDNNTVCVCGCICVFYLRVRKHFLDAVDWSNRNTRALKTPQPIRCVLLQESEMITDSLSQLELITKLKSPNCSCTPPPSSAVEGHRSVGPVTFNRKIQSVHLWFEPNLRKLPRDVLEMELTETNENKMPLILNYYY